ncbi:unnamed protein product [Cyprideis torosa]|uniref:Uncharacterized protein n=1 Tax=Cyprideis torosa TaxID=163714 RepID=A0A7R8W910_9CRUS|nr:unnamed protein product [Cyprideis torosa]CAG0888075.1 unnamed protein product [Cyprideis torosa]
MKLFRFLFLCVVLVLASSPQTKAWWWFGSTTEEEPDSSGDANELDSNNSEDGGLKEPQQHIDVEEDEAVVEDETPSATGLKDHYDEEGIHNAEYDREIWQGAVNRLTDEEESGDRIREIFQTMDANGDGEVDQAELKVMNTNYTQMEAEQKLFEAADTNNDGFLNLEEFITFFSPDESGETIGVALESRKKMVDSDGDGAVDFEEFIGDDSRQKNREWMEAKRKEFQSYDGNGDAELTGAELLDWLLPGFRKITEEETEHLFHFTDRNHDGSLSLEEIAESLNLFAAQVDLNDAAHDEL